MEGDELVRDFWSFWRPWDVCTASGTACLSVSAGSGTLLAVPTRSFRLYASVVALLDSVPCLVMHFLAYRAGPPARSMLLVHSACSPYLFAALTSFATQSVKDKQPTIFLPQLEPFPWHLWIACPKYVCGNTS